MNDSNPIETPSTPCPVLVADARDARLIKATATGLILIVATVLALWQMDRSYWNDEAWGVDFAMASSLPEVWELAIRNQLPGAPGYLALLHATDQVNGWGPWVYRLPTIAAGLMLILATLSAARQWCGSWSLAAIAPLFLLANPFVQRYFAEAKQYMGDVGFMMALFVATRCWLTTPSLRVAIIWTLLAVVGVTMSFAFWFSVAATGPMLLMIWLRRGNRTQVYRVIIAGIATAVSAGVVYFAYAKTAASGQGGMGFWQPYFLPRDLSALGKLWDYWHGFMEGSWVPYNVPTNVMMIVAAIGLIIWIRRDPLIGTAALLTLVITVVANLAGQWPMVIRVNLPIIVILNLACIAVPIAAAGWCYEYWCQKRSGKTSAASVQWSSGAQWLAMAPALCLAIITLERSSHLEHEPSNIHALLDETAKRSGVDDLVILDWASRVNQQVNPRPIKGEIRHVDWGDFITIEQSYGSLIRPHLHGKSFVIASIVNHERSRLWDVLGDSLKEIGTFEKVWSDTQRRTEVAIYEFRPHKPQSP